MTRRLTAAVFGLGVLGYALPLPGAEGPEEKGPKQSFAETKTERVKFPLSGTIRLNDSYGYLSVDGWDEPEVEITVIKSTDRFYEPGEQREAKRRLDLIRVVTERPSESELSITTIRASRNGTWSPPLPPTTKAGVTVELRLHVPRDSRLVIHHDTGYTRVSDVRGEIEARSHTGDMIVMLPDPGSYAIDARTRLGSVLSDFTGADSKRLVAGTRFVHAATGPSRRVRLRMGRGSITIKKSPAPGPFGNN